MTQTPDVQDPETQTPNTHAPESSETSDATTTLIYESVENTGNIGNTDSSDKNQPTGVPLAVVPAALAAAAFVGSLAAKKRK